MQELIPKEPDFDERVLSYSDGLSEFMSDAARNSQKLNRVPRNAKNRERFLNAMAEAFEIVGGVPRLALWADANLTEFYKIAGKQVPALVQQGLQINANGPVTIVSALPRSPLDGEEPVDAQFTEVSKETPVAALG